MGIRGVPHCWNMGKFKTILFIFTGTTQISGELLLAVLRHTLDIFPISRNGYSRDGSTSFPRFQAKRFRKCESNLEARHEAELLNSFQENSHLAHLHPTHTSQTTMTIINKQEALLRNPARHPPHPHRQERVQHDECEVLLDWLIPKNAQPAQPRLERPMCRHPCTVSPAVLCDWSGAPVPHRRGGRQ